MTTNALPTTTDLILAEAANLRRIARRLTRCESDADDLVQDTLFRAFKARDRFLPGTSIRAWTSTILRRVFLTAAIRTKRRGLENDTDANEPLSRATGTPAPTGCDQVLPLEKVAELVDDDLKRALERVPETYRVPFYLQTIRELSCAEIARVLGVPEGTVMSRIHRARLRLKAELAGSPVVADMRSAPVGRPARLRPLGRPARLPRRGRGRVRTMPRTAAVA